MTTNRNPAVRVTNERVVMTPKQLAAEIGCDPKSLRGYLRKNFTRSNDVKNTSWIITDDAANAARAHFAKQETVAVTANDDTNDEGDSDE